MASREDRNRLIRSNPEDFETQFCEVIRRRIHHCETACLNNLQDATVCPDMETIVWLGGHFNIAVHEELVKALDQKPKEWSTLIWQQIVRQMYEEQNQDEIMFRIATEMLAVK